MADSVIQTCFTFRFHLLFKIESFFNKDKTKLNPGKGAVRTIIFFFRTEVHQIIICTIQTNFDSRKRSSTNDFFFFKTEIHQIIFCTIQTIFFSFSKVMLKNPSTNESEHQEIKLLWPNVNINNITHMAKLCS